MRLGGVVDGVGEGDNGGGRLSSPAPDAVTMTGLVGGRWRAVM